MPRRLACLAGALAASLCCASPALAQPQSSRIINGTAAAQGEYPAQGFLELATIQGTFVCGGSLVSNRHFVTAAHCATQPDTTIPLDESAFTVTLGKVDKDTFQASDERGVAVNDVHEDYALSGRGVPENDVALLTLAGPAPAALDPLSLVEAGETTLWADGVSATIIGWGATESGSLSDALLEATVPMRPDAFCGDAGVWGSSFSATSMVCAGGGETDTCGGDSGGPLMVGDGSSWSSRASPRGARTGAPRRTSRASTPGSAPRRSTRGCASGCRWCARACRTPPSMRGSARRSPPRPRAASPASPGTSTPTARRTRPARA